MAWWLLDFVYLPITLVLFNIFPFCFLFFTLWKISEWAFKSFETKSILKVVKILDKVIHVWSSCTALNEKCQAWNPILYLSITLVLCFWKISEWAVKSFGTKSILKVVKILDKVIHVWSSCTALNEKCQARNPILYLSITLVLCFFFL